VTPESPMRADVPATAMGFQTTHWTMVLAAREKDGKVARECAGQFVLDLLVSALCLHPATRRKPA